MAMLSVTLTHGSSKHSVQVSGAPGGKEPTLSDLAQAVAAATAVPEANQKLIFKGKSLNTLKEPDRMISACGMKNGCKIMLIGKKNSPEEESALQRLTEMEKSGEQLSFRLNEIQVELKGIQNGYLEKNLRGQALTKLEKRVKAVTEQCMKLLEQADGTELPENFSDCRMKRKRIVKKIQSYLDHCDTLEKSVTVEGEKLQRKSLTQPD
ncbi:BAG family molecular chaperone regulator 1 [Lampetra fluviatilis]